jgi:uncharacterized delta-60 repeat protein
MKFVLIFLCVAARLADAMPGDLDPTFGEGGKVVNDFGGHTEITALAIQKDGKILAAGNAGWGASFIVVRYHTDGTLDTSFGTGGAVYTGFSSDSDIDSLCTSMAIDSNGRIVLAGKLGDYFGDDFVVARYESNGTLDTTFGTDGAAITAIADGEGAEGLLIQPDGKLVLTGLQVGGGGSHMVVLRHNTDGTLDGTFGNGGIASAHFADYTYRSPVEGTGSSTLQQDGKIVAAGSVNQTAVVVRFNPDGTLDKPFTKNGVPLVPSSSTKLIKPVVALQTDGEIVVAGTLEATWDDGLDGIASLSRFGSTGNRLGHAEDLPALNSARAVATDRRGAILVAGHIYRDGLPRFAVTRLNKDGSADPTFGKRGNVTTSFGDSFDTASSIAIQADGKIIVAGKVKLPGSDRGGFALARYMGGHFQADMRSGRSPDVKRGNDIYNRTGEGPSQVLYVERNHRVSKAFIGIQNDSSAADSFIVKGSGSHGAFSVKYFHEKRDVTQSVVAGTYVTGKLEPGAIHHLKMVIKSASGDVSKWREFSVKAVSKAHPAGKDRISIVSHKSEP